MRKRILTFLITGCMVFQSIGMPVYAKELAPGSEVKQEEEMAEPGLQSMQGSGEEAGTGSEESAAADITQEEASAAADPESTENVETEGSKESGEVSEGEAAVQPVETQTSEEASELDAGTEDMETETVKGEETASKEQADDGGQKKIELLGIASADPAVEDYVWENVTVTSKSYVGLFGFKLRQWPDGQYFIMTTTDPDKDFNGDAVSLTADEYSSMQESGYQVSQVTVMPHDNNGSIVGAVVMNGLAPQTTYYYRVLRYDSGSTGDKYCFLTEKAEFTTLEAVAESKVSITDVKVVETGLAGAAISFNLDNPEDEFFETVAVRRPDGEIEYCMHKRTGTVEVNVPFVAAGENTYTPYVIVTDGDGKEKIKEGASVTVTASAQKAEGTVNIVTAGNMATLSMKLQGLAVCDRELISATAYYREAGGHNWQYAYPDYSFKREADGTTTNSIVISGLKENVEYEYYVEVTPSRMTEWTLFATEPNQFQAGETVVLTEEDIPDETLRSALQAEVGEDVLTTANLAQITYFMYSNAKKPIHDLKGIEYLTGAAELNFYGQEFQTADEVTQLTQLRSLAMTNGDLKKMPDLSGMESLTDIYMNGNLLPASEIIGDRLPAGFVQRNPDWIENTIRYQRRAFQVRTAGEYYETGDGVWPFIIAISGIKVDQNYTLSVTVDGITSEGTKFLEPYYNDDVYMMLQHLQIDVESGSEKEVTYRLTGENGIVYAEETVTCIFTKGIFNGKTYLRNGDSSFQHTLRISKAQRDELGTLVRVELIDKQGRLFGTADSVTETEFLQEDLYEDVFPGAMLEMEDKGKQLEFCILLAENPEAGVYDIRIVGENGSSIVISDVVEVTDCYRGTLEEDEEGRYLTLSQQEAMEAGDMVFDDDYILGLLHTYYAKEKFEGINVQYYAESMDKAVDTISPVLWEGLRAHLSDSESRWIAVQSGVSDREYMIFMFYAPGKLEAVMSLGIQVDTDNRIMTFAETQYPSADAWAMLVSDEMRGLFESGRDLYLMDGDSVAAYGYFGTGEDNKQGKLSVQNIRSLEAGKDYHFTDMQQEGWLLEWHSEQTGQDQAQLCADLDAVREKLSNITDAEWNEVQISKRGEMLSAIPAKVFQIYAECGKTLKFLYHNEENESGAEWFDWRYCFEGLKADAEYVDYPLTAVLSQNGDDLPAAIGKSNFYKIEGVAPVPECGNSWLNIWKEDLISSFYIRDNRLIQINRNRDGNDTVVDEQNVNVEDPNWINIDISREAGAYYISDAYLGMEYEWTDEADGESVYRRGLRISEWELNDPAGVLSGDQIAAIIGYRQQQEAKFDQVYVEYLDRTAAKKLLAKKVFDAAKSILYDGGELTVRFADRNSYDAEEWCLQGLGTLSGNVQLGLTVSVNGKLVSIKRAYAGAIPADYAGLNLSGERYLNKYTADESGNEVLLCTEKSGALIPFEPTMYSGSYYDVWTDEENGTQYGRIELHQIQNMAAKTAYTICSRRQQNLVSGDNSWSIPENENRSSAKGYSVNESVATVISTGVVSALNSGETFITLKWADQNKTAQGIAYQIYVEEAPLANLWMDEQELELVWNPDQIDESTGLCNPQYYLRAFAEPGDAFRGGSVRAGLRWSIEEWCNDSEYNPEFGLDSPCWERLGADAPGSVIRFRTWTEDGGETDVNSLTWDDGVSIVPVGAGTARVRLSYQPQVWSEEESRWIDGDGEEIVYGYCVVTVKEEETYLNGDSVDWPDACKVILAGKADVRLEDVAIGRYVDLNGDGEKNEVDYSFEEGHWSWKDGNTVLSVYAGTGTSGMSFPAVYTYQDAGGIERTQEHRIWVEFREIEKIAARGWDDVIIDSEEPARFWLGIRDGLNECSNAGDFTVNWKITNSAKKLLDEQYNQEISGKADGSNDEYCEYLFHAKKGDSYVSGNSIGTIAAGSATVTATLCYRGKAIPGISAKKTFNIVGDNKTWFQFFARTLNEDGYDDGTVQPGLDEWNGEQEFWYNLDSGRNDLLLIASTDNPNLTAGNENALTKDYTITWKSGDSSILAVTKSVENVAAPGEGDSYPVWGTRTAATVKKTGTVKLTVTAVNKKDKNDKTTGSLIVHVIRPDIQLASGSLTLNAAMTEGLIFDSYTQGMSPEDVLNEVAITDKKGNPVTDFQLKRIYQEDENGGEGSVTNQWQLTLADKDEFYKKYSKKNALNYKNQALTFRFSYNQGDKIYPKDIAVKLTVTDTLPKVKSTKWESKVKSFYTTEEGYGVAYVKVPGERIVGVELTGDTCQYELKYDHENVPEDERWLTQTWGGDMARLVIGLKENGNKNAKNAVKGTLKLDLEGYETPVTASFTVSVDKSKPTMALSATSETLYPALWGDEESWQEYAACGLKVYDKKTGEQLFWDGVQYWNGSGTAPDSYIAMGAQNNYELFVPEEGSWLELRPIFGLNEISSKKKSTKIILTVKMPGWTEALKLPAYTVKINTGKPSLKLGSSTLKLNMYAESIGGNTGAAAIGTGEKASTTIGYKDSAMWQGFNGGDIRITGANAAATEVLKQCLVFDIDDNQGKLSVRFNGQDGLDKLKKLLGSKKSNTYSYKVWVTVGGEYTLTTALKVNVYNSEPKAAVKKTGSIDVLRRDTTFITYTPSLKNITGEIGDVRIVDEYGRSGGILNDIFEVYWDGSKAVLRARRWADIPEASYKLKLAFQVNNDYMARTVYTDTQTVKLTQGKPSVTLKVNDGDGWILSDCNWSNERWDENGEFIGSCTWVSVDAMLKDERIAVSNVQLMNYTEDFWLCVPDDQWSNDNNDGIHGFELRRGSYSQALKNGTYTLKIRVTYREKIGTNKDVTVNCKLVLK